MLRQLVERSAPRLSLPPAGGEEALPRRSLRAALQASGVRVIAEVKHRSPSAGVLRQPLDPRSLAQAYERGGAAALSVVTEPEFFGGSTSWVRVARQATGLPVLQKDFFSRPEHVAYGVAAGADAILLIARALPGALLGEMLDCCRKAGVEALVETHSAAEVERAVAVGAELIGVNARDLATFSVDVERAADLVGSVPPPCLGVLESGIASRTQLLQLVQRGISRFLVGEYLLRQADPEAALRGLLA